MNKILDLKKYLDKITDGGKVFDFLNALDGKDKKGKYVFNDNLYVNVISCETYDNAFSEEFEMHKEYLDIHVLITGKERIFYGQVQNMKEIKPYNFDEDYALLKSNIYLSVTYGQMESVVFDINEPHMAGYAVNGPENILKAVVKVKRAKE